MLSNYRELRSFDKITEFRLINSVLVALGMALVLPVIVSLKGLYFSAWLIGVFSIVQTLTVKLNSWILKHFSIRTMYHIGVLIHIGYILMSLLYFVDPLFMLWCDSILGIVEVAIFSTYSLALNNYITENYPQDMSRFQVLRNSIWADGYLFGLGVVTLVSIWSVSVSVVVFILYNIVFSAWMIKNWKIYDDSEYCV